MSDTDKYQPKELVVIKWKDKDTGEIGTCYASLMFRYEAERLMKYLACDKEKEYWIEAK